MSCTKNPEKNLGRAIEKIREAARKGAQIVCLQELFTSLYFCDSEDYENFKLAEPVPGPSSEVLSTLAKELGVVIIASLFEKRTNGIYHNTTAVLDADGNILGKSRKMHIPDDPSYYEKFYFTPGDLGFQSWKTACGNLGVCVCWDQWYPEAARLTALRGAEILFYPTAIGWHPREKKTHGTEQHNAWETIQRSHAIANGCYVAATNRIGLGKPAGGERLELFGLKFVARASREILG